MNKITKINTIGDIPKLYLNTPIEKLIKYHNFNIPYDNYDKAEILIGMCIDNRKQLNIPNNFAYIIRTGGANLKYSEFKVSYDIAIGNVKHIVLIAHNNCTQ
jgi:carbonic anhydrase